MALLDHRPQLTSEAAAEHLARHYGLQAVLTPLASERDQNFLVDAGPAGRFVLKVANATEDRDFLNAQHAVLDRLAQATGMCPRIVPSRSGHAIETVDSAGEQLAGRHLARLVTYLDGAPLAHVRRPTLQLLGDLGHHLGRVDAALAGFDHPALRRTFHWDLRRALDEIAGRLALVDDAMRAQVGRLAHAVAPRLASAAPHLRTGVIHNDANDHNVLVEWNPVGARPPRVTGLIDFGDMIHSWLVAEPAVAIAYALLDCDDPLAAAASITAGYHAEHPLLDEEIGIVFDLACLRLCVSVCMAADQQRQRPDDEYLAVSQGAIRRTLPRLAAIPARFATAVLRHACGLAPVPSSSRIVEWIESRRGTFSPVAGLDLRTEPCAVLDLGATSPLVSGDPALNTPEPLGARINEQIALAGASVGLGRYDEPRLLYTSPIFAVEGRRGEWRTVHLGVDLFAPAGTPVCAPLAGTVHAFRDQAGPLDYGPVVLLRHETGRGEAFFTLYGHLSRESLGRLTPGAPVAAGERFAALGGTHENGGWPPHLHLQLIADLLDLGTDYPGVCHADQREVWRHLSPDPTALFGVPRDRLPAPGPDRPDTLAARRARLGSNLSLAYREPLKVVRGWMQYLWDDTGRRLLDAYNNVPHVGHCHPRVVEAGRRQMGLLNTNTRYLHDLINEYAGRLSATLPGPLSVCYFVNSASEANELALRLARAHTGARDTIVLDAAYHGHTTSLIDMSPYKHAGPGGRGAPPWVHVAPLPDDYRGLYRRGETDLGLKYARHVRGILEHLRAEGIRPMGFIAETCPSVGGQIFLPEGYLADVYAAVRDAGGLCIADEVQTGYGRIGTHFWAFEAHGVVPDIVVMGKPIGNGHPIGAVVTSPEIARSFDNGMEFFSTFGGSTVSCAIGLAVLDVVRDEGWQGHAQRVGGHLLARLRPLVDRHRLVGDVRGSGLFLGVELVRDRATRDPAGPEASWVANRLCEMGILLGTDGPHHNVVKIRPPMPFDERNADALADALEEALGELG